ncbi:MAG: hypothetical protein HBSAPP02_27370 [Phycisphaerae bacterium]|nr:MAG: hypothetical protein HRU71_01405 [Planctomycetia bacterium]GJQ27705.1 MAG: hypothetical protein HBSAPP02_27370 [Phycisphaerae bacterium]
MQARGALAAAAPATFDLNGNGLFFLPRDSLSIEPVGDQLWEGVARYSNSAPQTDESVFAFDTGGGTQHITQSLQTVGAYGSPGQAAPNFKGAIGVTADSVEGVDITVPVYQFSETHYLDDAYVTPAYKGTLFALTGKVNGGGFKGLDRGECLFLGASGSKRGSGDWEINYRFAASPNVTGLNVGDISGINKKGWEYLWVRYMDTEDTFAKALVKKPVAVYIEQVYPYGNFGGLGI